MMAELQMEMSMNPPTAGTFNPRRSAKCAAKYTDGKWWVHQPRTVEFVIS